MKSLTQLIRVLKPVELRILRGMYQVKKNGAPNRKLELLNLILNRSIDDDNEAAKKIYKSKPGPKFTQLKDRLRKDVLNVLLVPDPTQQYKTLINQKKLECQKLFIKGKILLSDARSLEDEALKLFEKALKIAQTYGFAVDEIQIRASMRRTKGRSGGIEVFDQYSNGIDELLHIYQQELKAHEYYCRLWIPIRFNIDKVAKHTSSAKKLVNELEKMHNKNTSPTVSLWYYHSAIFYYQQLCNKPEQALPLFDKLIQLIKNEKRIYSESALGGAMMMQTGVLVSLEQFEESIKVGNGAIPFIKKGSASWAFLHRMLSCSYLHLGNYKAAYDLCQLATKDRFVKKLPILIAEFTFYQAYVHFFQKDYDAAINAIQKCEKLNKNKTANVIGYKLLHIYILFEQKENYLLEFQLENFRKLLDRNKEYDISRAKLIHKTAASLLRNNLDFKLVQKKKKKSLELLKKAEGDYHWPPDGYEVLRFEKWVASF